MESAQLLRFCVRNGLPLSSAELRNAVFGQAKGAKAYDEAVVDVYLERAITVLVAVE